MQTELEKAAEKEARLVHEFMDEFCEADFDSRPVLATGKYDRDELIEGLAHHAMFLQSDQGWEHLGYATVDTARLLIADPDYDVNVNAEEWEYARNHGGFIRPVRDGRALSHKETDELTEQLRRGETEAPLWTWEKCDENAPGLVVPKLGDSYEHTREIPLEKHTSAVVIQTGYGDGKYSVEGRYMDTWMGRKLSEIRVRFIDEEGEPYGWFKADGTRAKQADLKGT